LGVENPTTRQVATLSKVSESASFQPTAVSMPDVTPLASGPARIHANVYSAVGPPRIRLDDRWDLVSVTPSEGSLAIYDVDFYLDDSSTHPHVLSAIPPVGASVSHEFVVLPGVQSVATQQGKLTTKAAVTDTRIGTLAAVLQVRPLAAAAKGALGDAVPFALQVRASLREDAESVRAALYLFPKAAHDRAAAETIKVAPEGSRLRKGEGVVLNVPVAEDLAHGTYRLELQACTASRRCDDELPATLDINL
jgi:hypothetical protein